MTTAPNLLRLYTTAVHVFIYSKKKEISTHVTTIYTLKLCYRCDCNNNTNNRNVQTISIRRNGIIHFSK